MDPRTAVVAAGCVLGLAAPPRAQLGWPAAGIRDAEARLKP
jgi:hypothetical protein